MAPGSEPESVTSTSTGSPGCGVPFGASASTGVAFTMKVSDGAAHAATASACSGVPGRVSVHVYQPAAGAERGGVVAVPVPLASVVTSTAVSPAGVAGSAQSAGFGLPGNGPQSRAVTVPVHPGRAPPTVRSSVRSSPTAGAFGWAAVASFGVRPLMVAVAVAVTLVRGAAPTVRWAAWSGEPRSA